jgi:hypothetical protein
MAIWWYSKKTKPCFALIEDKIPLKIPSKTISWLKSSSVERRPRLNVIFRKWYSDKMCQAESCQNSALIYLAIVYLKFRQRIELNSLNELEVRF